MKRVLSSKLEARAAPNVRRCAAAAPPPSASSSAPLLQIAAANLKSAAAAALCSALLLSAAPLDADAAQRARQPPVDTADAARCEVTALDKFADTRGLLLVP